MHRSLKELEKVIFGGNMTDEEWLKLDKEVDEAWKSAKHQERKAFEDSGAGNMLGQIIEFMD